MQRHQFAITPTNNWGNKIFSRFIHVSTLNWALFRCSLPLNCHNKK
jgi:hypothetical protein